MKIFTEQILEPITRYFRFKKAIKLIKGQNLTIVDIGCGPQIRFYHKIKKQNIKLKRYIGIDPLVEKNVEKGAIKIIRSKLFEAVPLKSQIADYVVALAVIEHLDKPKEAILEMVRLVKPKGKIIITTPTPTSKTILETLAFKLGIISKREIKEHKRYFSKKDLIRIASEIKNIKFFHSYFELGLNNLLVIEKKKIIT